MHEHDEGGATGLAAKVQQHRQDMEAAGGYIGFRAGIDPNGSLVFFVAGD